MTSMFSTALIGLFLLSNVGTATATTSDWTKAVPEVPTYKQERYSVSMTGYNAVAGQTDDTPFITASGATTNPDITAARSRDLADELPFGTVIEIIPTDATSTRSCGLSVVGDDIGLRVIADSMHPRKRNQIDILFHNDDAVLVSGKYVNPAKALGVCKGVTINVVGHIDIAHMPHTQTQLLAALGKATFALNR